MPSGSKSEQLTQLSFERATSIAALHSFSCGQATVDRIIQELEDHLPTNDLYLVKEGEDVVALFCLQKDNHALFLSDATRDKMRCGIKPMPSVPLNEYLNTFASKELSLLAVRKDYQRRRLGSFIIEMVMEKLVREKEENCEFLIVKALCEEDYSAVPFYEKCGFFPSQVFRKGDMSLTMYRVIR